MERWKDTIKSKRFRLSRSKIEQFKCRFSEGFQDKMTIGGVVIPRVEKFKYLGLIIQARGDIDEDISHQIKVGWQK